MILILLGTLVMLGAVAIALGSGSDIHLPGPDLYPLLGLTGVVMLATSGFYIALQGAMNFAVQRWPHCRDGLIRARYAMVSLLFVLALTLMVPMQAEALGLVRVGEFSLRSVLVGLGVLVGLVVVSAFAEVRCGRFARGGDNNA